MPYQPFFTKLCQTWQLGQPLTPPVPVSGGYLHRMFRLDTPCGSYAVKLLNTEIMKRPTAMGNFRQAEALESLLETNSFPVVAALPQNGSKMQQADGQCYYLFPWVQGQALQWQDFTPDHCRLMGDLLARMHALQQRPATEPIQAENHDWEEVLRQAQSHCPALAPLIADHLPLLQRAQEAYRQAHEALPPIQCICNGDMDPKNVLWQGMQPRIIDLECLAWGNPYQDLIPLCLDWAGGPPCHTDWDKLTAFLAAYRAQRAPAAQDWQALSGLGFSGLDWLRYNLRRACGVECMDEAERSMGEKQVRHTLPRIAHYDAIRPRVAQLLQDLLA